MIITSKNFLDTVKIYDTNNLIELNNLNNYMAQYDHFYNKNDDMVLMHDTWHEVVIRAGAKRILCTFLDAGDIYYKRGKRDEYKSSEIFAGIKPINARVKTNLTGFKQWCKVESWPTTDGEQTYSIRNKAGRVVRFTPYTSPTGRVFQGPDKITAVKRV